MNFIKNCLPVFAMSLFLSLKSVPEKYFGADEVELIRRFSITFLLISALLFLLLGFSDYGSKTVHLGGSRIATPLFVAIMPVLTLLWSLTQRSLPRN